jgi:hypothetical protein
MANAHSLDAMTADDFRAVRGERFRLTGSSPLDGSAIALDVELADVTGQAGGPSRAGFRVPFSVEFHGPLTPVLPQRIYRLEHEQFGAVELFLVPIGFDEPSEPGQRPTAMRYEAAFG